MPIRGPELASKADRIVAYVFDVAMVGLVFAFVVYTGDEAIRMNLESPLVYGLLFFLYHFAFLSWNNGTSFGKSLRNICVINARGSPLLIAQAATRAALLAVPYVLLWLPEALGPLVAAIPDGPYLAKAPAALWVVAELFMLESRGGPITLTDRLAQTIVVNIPPPQPHRAPAIPMYSATDAEFGPTPGKSAGQGERGEA